MAEFIFKGIKVYFEEHGKGEPLLIMNGIFMSAASWHAFIPNFSKYNKVILVDFIDQGKTEHVDYNYTQVLQVELTLALLEHLSIERVNLLGISYGGSVAMQFATQYPEKVTKLILANATPYTSPWLLDMGKSWEYAMASYDGRQFFKTCIAIVYSPNFYTKNLEWAKERETLFTKSFSPAIFERFIRLIRSSENHDVRHLLSTLAMPTLVISSEYDFITPLHDQQFIVDHIKGASHVIIKDAGHASMYEKPREFCALVTGFTLSDLNIHCL